MATRAYVQPKTILGNIQYLNPGYESISIDKVLTPLDSSVQCLNPGNNNLKIILPEEIYCEGMIFDIMNSTNQNGLLEIYESTSTTKLFDLRPLTRRQVICLGGVWQSYVAFNMSYQDLPVEEENYIFSPSMTSNEINDIISNINTYIHPNKILNLKFEDGDFNNLNLFINNFYGGGILNITCTDITCYPKLISTTGNCIEFFNNNGVDLNVANIIIEANGYNIQFKENLNSNLNVRDCRIINTEAGISGHGIHCTFDGLNTKFRHSNINIKNIQFGNLDVCVYINGDYTALITQSEVALSESSNPTPMINNNSCWVGSGSKVVMDNLSKTNLGVGHIESGLFFDMS